MQLLRLTTCAIVLIVGCHQPSPTFSARLVPDVSFCKADYPVAWEAAKDVLRRHHFRIDETNRRSGRITTYPEVSRNFFEFWRDDWATSRDVWESSIATIRRRAVVEINRIAHEPGCRIVVTVRKERLSTPERQINNSAAAAHFLSTRLPAARTGRVVTKDQTGWIDLGRDPPLEDKLRRAIVRELSHNVSVESEGAHTGDDPPATSG